MGNGQRDGAAHWRIGRASDGWRGVVGDSWSIDRDHWSCGIDGAAVGSRTGVASGIGDRCINGVRAFSKPLRYIDGVGATSQNRGGHGNDIGALSNCQGNCATNRRIGRAGDGWGRVVGDSWSIDRDHWSCGIDGAAVGSRTGVASGIGDRCINGVRAFSKPLRYIDGVGATSQNRGGHGNHVGALGNSQGYGAAHRCISSASDARRGVVGDGRGIDGDCRSSSVDGTAVSG